MTQFIYIFILLIGLCLGYLAQKTKNKVYMYSIIVLFTLAAGFRGKNCGVDTPQYYANIIGGFPYSWMLREEGFRAVANFFMDKYNNPQMVFVFCAFVTNLFVFLRLWDFRKETNFGFMTLLYILMYYSNSLNIMRQYVAVALIFYGSRFLKNNKILFMLFLILGFLFHRSSLIAIGFLAISLWTGFTKKQKKILFIPMAVIIAITIGYVGTYLASDISSYSSQVVHNTNITYFYLLIITIFSLITYKMNIRVKVSDLLISSNVKNYKIELDIILYVLIGLVFSALSMFFAFVGRAGLYFSVYEVVFWGIASKKLKNANLNRALILVYAFYVFILIIAKNDAKLFPYEIYFY